VHRLSESIERKFTNVYNTAEWEIKTDSGWQDLIDVKQTVEYEIWKLELANGKILECADNHIVFDSNSNEIFVKELTTGQEIITENGLLKVKDVSNTNISENMYDVGVNSTTHRFYSNGILSHNSTTSAGYLLWYAMFVPDSTILIAAHIYAGSQEIMTRIRYAYESVPDFIRAGAVSYNKGNIDFDNGSRIMSSATTENTGRGLSISLLYLDELAAVRNSIAKSFWTSITPTLSTGGKAIITSTPNSDDDQFWEIWVDANKTTDEFGNETLVGRNGFKAFKAIWSEHPDRDEKWADDQRSKLGIDRFLREHQCEPIIFEETLINAVKLTQLQGIDPIEKQGQVRWYKKPKIGNTYIVALDPSLGTGGDFAAIQIFELPTFEQVGEWQHNKTPIQQQIKLLRDIIEYIYSITKSEHTIYYSVENNGIGEATLVSISEIGEENIHGYFMSEPAKLGNSRRYRKGFTTTNSSKLTACAKFKQLVESKRLVLNSKNLISELKTFVASGQSYNARSGDTDDLVSATLLVIRMMTTLQSYDAELDNKMRDMSEPLSMPLPFIMS
jgi:hypothetical protein